MFDLNLHHHQDRDRDRDAFSPQLQYSCSSSSSLSNPTFLMTAGFLSDFPIESHKQEAKKSETGCDHSPPIVNEQVESDDKGVKFKIRSEDNNTSSAKWMSSKMRMMRKMITSSDNGSTVVDHPPTTITKLERLSSPDNNSNSSSCNNSSSVRVCVDCNTTKTPLWRSGPTGPKSLCNACGIRQRKARRAMAAAANGEASNINPPPMKKGIKHKNKRSSQPDHNDAPKFKKRCKINIKNNLPSNISSRKTISFEDLRMSLISNAGFEQVFPQDEKEAAILLMALSYGLVH